MGPCADCPIKFLEVPYPSPIARNPISREDGVDFADCRRPIRALVDNPSFCSRIAVKKLGARICRCEGRNPTELLSHCDITREQTNSILHRRSDFVVSSGSAPFEASNRTISATVGERSGGVITLCRRNRTRCCQTAPAPHCLRSSSGSRRLSPSFFPGYRFPATGEPPADLQDGAWDRVAETAFRT
jgi:hypothetical protein